MNLYEKLRAVQLELKAPKNHKNDFGGFNYRSAEDIEAAVKPLLNTSGLTMLIADTIEHIGERYYVRSTVHLTDGDGHIESNGWAREVDTKKGCDPAQITGMASSYARKYALGGLFLIDDQPDADAQQGEQPDHLKQAKSHLWSVLKETMGEDAAKSEIEAIKAREEFKDTPDFWNRIASSYEGNK